MRKTILARGTTAVLLAGFLAILAGTTALAVGKDGAVITNSGSTNTAGYSIKVWSDGSGLIDLRGGGTRSIKLDVDLVAKFFADVKAARANPGSPGRCMKSASFGTTTSVLWHSYQSVDLQCPPFTMEVTALSADVRNIQAAANLANPLRRIRLPLEPRKIPSATPEATPS